MIISEMNVKLTASTSAFARQMDKAADKIKGFRAGAGKVGASLSKVGADLKAFAMQAAAAAAVIAGIAWGAKKVFSLGASIAETGSKFRTVFGSEASAEVSAFLDNFANKAGLTTTEAKALVATTGAIAQGLGFTQKASGQAAIAITKLAGDLSSFNNIPTADTLHAISSALTGEREQLKALGIVVQEADVQARAFANTGKTVAKTLTQQEKATATLQIITEKAGVAIGDLNRTQGSAANVAKRLWARFLEIRDALVNAVLPAFTELLTKLEDNEGKFVTLKNEIIENAGAISAWASVGFSAMALFAKALIAPFKLALNLGLTIGELLNILTAFAVMDLDGMRDALDRMNTHWDKMGEAILNVTEAELDFAAVFMTAFMGVTTAAGDASDAFKNLTPVIRETADEGGDALTDLVDVVETLESRLKSLTERFANDFVGRMADAVQGGKDAFAGFFAWMSKKLIEMAIKFLLFKAIMQIKGGEFGEWAERLTGFGAPSKVKAGADIGTGADYGKVVGKVSTITGVIGSAQASRKTVVNQTINFTVSAIDGRSASQFLREQGGTIADVVAQAAKDSTGYRRQLQGA